MNAVGKTIQTERTRAVATPKGFVLIKEKTEVNVVAIVPDDQPQRTIRTCPSPAPVSTSYHRPRASSSSDDDSGWTAILWCLLILGVVVGIGIGIGVGIAAALSNSNDIPRPEAPICAVRTAPTITIGSQTEPTTNFSQTTASDAMFGHDEFLVQSQSDSFSFAVESEGRASFRNCKDVCDQISTGEIFNHPVGFASIGASARIYPSFYTSGIDVYCDCSTSGAPWTVFQRRLDGSVDFYRNRDEYVAGFGNTSAELWLGLEAIYRFTNDGSSHELRVDIEAWTGYKRYAVYKSFQLRSKYILSVGGYHGNSGDSLSYHNSQGFSTRDLDKDSSTSSCANEHDGGWWFSDCYQSHLNGPYQSDDAATASPFLGIAWNSWLQGYSFKSAEMKFN